MADKLVFQTNVPETVALKYADGKRVESRYNEYEQLYSLVDGRVLSQNAIMQMIAPQIAEAARSCQ